MYGCASSFSRKVTGVAFAVSIVLVAGTGAVAEERNSQSLSSPPSGTARPVSGSRSKSAVSDASVRKPAAGAVSKTAAVRAPAAGAVNKTAAVSRPAVEVPSTEAPSRAPARDSQIQVSSTDAAESGKKKVTWEEIKAEMEKRHQNALEHWELSKKYFGEWDWGMCETELDLAVLWWPSMQIAHRDLAVLNFISLNWPRSLAEFMMTVGLGESIPLTQEESEALTERAMTRHYKKGLEFARRGDWQNTIKELNLAEKLVPEDYVIHRSLAFAYANLGQFDLSEQEYRRTFELAPEDGSAHADLAYFLASRGNLAEAQAQLEAATKASPEATAYHVDLGWMAESRGDFDTASRELKAAVELNPKQAGLWAHLGRVLERKGNTQEAQEAFAQAVALDPNLPEAKEHLAKLQAGS